LPARTGAVSACIDAAAQSAYRRIWRHNRVRDNGVQFSFPPRYADGPTARYMTHMFDMRCRENGIDHRLTKIKHPWTNGQLGRMNRTIKEATVKRYHYDRHYQFRSVVGAPTVPAAIATAITLRARTPCVYLQNMQTCHSGVSAASEFA
jgi:hypothetical protein